MAKHVVGIVAAVAALLTGGWVAAAPYVLGPQAWGQPLSPATQAGVIGGLAVGVLSLLGLGIHIAALVERGRQAPARRFTVPTAAVGEVPGGGHGNGAAPPSPPTMEPQDAADHARADAPEAVDSPRVRERHRLRDLPPA